MLFYLKENELNTILVYEMKSTLKSRLFFYLILYSAGLQTGIFLAKKVENIQYLL